MLINEFIEFRLHAGFKFGFAPSVDATLTACEGGTQTSELQPEFERLQMEVTHYVAATT